LKKKKIIVEYKFSHRELIAQPFSSLHLPLNSMNSIKRHVITLFTRPNCSLCDQAKQILLTNIPPKLTQGHSLKLHEVNIDLPENSQAHAKYTYEVPVGLLGEKEVFRYWVNEDKLVQALNSKEEKEEKG
jgi:glutaredoxin